MSWVSQANIKTIMTAIRNKFTTSDLVIANDAKDTGVELNYASQDGLVTVSPISTSASTEAALHLSNGDDTKKTELTQGTLSYVTGTGSSETYNYMSLLGDGVTFGKNGGGNVQLGGVADPTSAQQVATKNYVDKLISELSEKKVNLTNLSTTPTFFDIVKSTSTTCGIYGCSITVPSTDTLYSELVKIENANTLKARLYATVNNKAAVPNILDHWVDSSKNLHLTVLLFTATSYAPSSSDIKAMEFIYTEL